MSHSVRNKIIASFLVTMLITTAVTGTIAFQYTRWHEHEISDKMGLTAAQSCASMLEFVKETEISDPNSEAYKECRQVMRDLCKSNRMDYMYAFRCNPENDTITYLFCVADDDKNDATMAAERGYGTVVDAKLSEQELAALDGDESDEALELNNKYGDMLAWFCRVEGWNGYVLAGADYSVSERRGRVFSTTAQIIGLLSLAFLALLFVQLYVLRRHVFVPIEVITERMKAFSAEKAGEFEPIPVDSRDEMGTIAEAFTKMAGEIDVYLKDIERMTSERVQANVEMDVASRIQQGLVPNRKSIEEPGFDVSAFARTAREVGGDFYDCLMIDDGRIAISIGDVSGKGVAASLFMAMARTMIHDSLVSGDDPAAALNKANERLCEENPEGMFVTAIVAVLDPVTGIVRYSNAGHMPPVLASDNVRLLDVDPGVLLGLFDDAGLVNHEMRLAKDEALLLYTDGLTEAVNPDNVFFGEERLVATAQAHAPYAAAQTLIDEMVNAVDTFAEDREQFDDLTLLSIVRTSEPTELPVDIASLSIVRERIMATDCADDFKMKACLACEEAFVNSASYSDAKHIWLEVTENDGALNVILADDGKPFDPTKAPVVEKDFEDLDTGGMGIGLVRQLASALDYRREGGRNILRIHFAPNNHA